MCSSGSSLFFKMGKVATTDLAIFNFSATEGLLVLYKLFSSCYKICVHYYMCIISRKLQKCPIKFEHMLT